MGNKTQTTLLFSIVLSSIVSQIKKEGLEKKKYTFISYRLYIIESVENPREFTIIRTRV